MGGEPADGRQVLSRVAFIVTNAKCGEMPGDCKKPGTMTATCRKANATQTTPGNTDCHLIIKMEFQKL